MRLILITNFLTLAFISALAENKHYNSFYNILNYRKTAIVFGNQHYRFTSSLNNPINDAHDISDSLRKIGFKVFKYINASRITMDSAIDEWVKILPRFDLSLFYFSGHGAEFRGENYLFPIDAPSTGDPDYGKHTISANIVLRMMEERSKINIVILDACRNNPLRKSESRFATRGLATMHSSGAFIGYATAPGKVAEDGKGRNGIYTEGILKYITTPNQTVADLFTKVNYYVKNFTKGQQTPYYTSSLDSNISVSATRKQGAMKMDNPQYIQLRSKISLPSNNSFLIVANSQTGELLLFDSKTMHVSKFIKTEYKPHMIASTIGQVVAIIDSTKKCLSIIDANSGEERRQFSFQLSPRSVVLAGEDRLAYVLFYDTAQNSKLRFLDVVSGENEEIEINGSANDLAISADGRLLYILSIKSKKNNTLILWDTKSRKVLRQLDLNYNSTTLAIAPNEKYIFIASNNENQNSKIRVLDGASFKEMDSISGIGHTFAFSLDNQYAFILTDYGAIQYSLKKKSVTNHFSFQTQPNGIVWTADGAIFAWAEIDEQIYQLDISEKDINTHSFNSDSIFEDYRSRVQASLEFKQRYVSDSLRREFQTIFDQTRSLVDMQVTAISNKLLNCKVLSETISLNFEERWGQFRNGIALTKDSQRRIYPFIEVKLDYPIISVLIRDDVTDSEEGVRLTIPKTKRSPFSSIIGPENELAIQKAVKDFFARRLNRLPVD